MYIYVIYKTNINMKLRIVVTSGEGGRKDGEDWVVSIHCFLIHNITEAKLKKKKRWKRKM